VACDKRLTECLSGGRVEGKKACQHFKLEARKLPEDGAETPASRAGFVRKHFLELLVYFVNG
jgi:hypothetical protein